MPSLWPLYRSVSTPHASEASAEANPDTTESTDAAAWNANPPLVIVEGFLSAAQSVVWGNEFRAYLGVGHQQLVDHFASESQASKPAKRRSALGSDRPVVFAPIGPVSSLHDRACELFYALRGGTVDYGEQHAMQHGHSRYGRHYDQPLCPSWGPVARGGDREKRGHATRRPGLPAHFIGHSLGGPTILRLQQLLRQGFFDQALSFSRHGEKQQTWSPEDLILSVTSVSSPFRGTPIVYSLGSEPVPYPKIRRLSFGDMLAKFVHIAAYLDLPFFDPHADAWHFSARKQRTVRARDDAHSNLVDLERGNVEARKEAKKEAQAGVRELLKQLWKSDWAEGRDCAPWECTFAERELDKADEGWGLDTDSARARHGRTWYRSYAGGMTMVDPSNRPEGPAFHRPETYWSLSPLTFTSHLIGRFDYAQLSPLPSFVESSSLQDLPSSWWENDGVVPLASQFHPLDCDPARCVHFHGMPASLPFGKRRKRPQSSDLTIANAGRMGTMSTISNSHPTDRIETPQELETPSDTAQLGGVQIAALPLPVSSSLRSSRTMADSARSAAKIAYLTSMRVLNAHETPLITPSEEDLISFFPQPSPTHQQHPPEQRPHPTTTTTTTLGTPALTDLSQPTPNLWYTFQLPNIDHTSLCPFWTGSELQKQFWTGMGFFLASVDRQANFHILG